MRDKLENYVRSHYNDVIVWDYEETNSSCYLRFTSKNSTYIMTMLKAGSHATIFKNEESVLI